MQKGDIYGGQKPGLSGASIGLVLAAFSGAIMGGLIVYAVGALF